MKTIILGLTGSIGMGKTVASNLFRCVGVPVFDSDEVVHSLLRNNKKTICAVGNAFPGVVKDGSVDRQLLGNKAFGDGAELKTLENILHPIVRKKRAQFTAAARRQRRPLILFDIPLLYETNSEKSCDYVAVVTAPTFLQRERVLRRPGMTNTKFSEILAKQTPDSQKRKRADFVIFSGLGRAESLKRIKSIKRLLTQKALTR